MADITLGNAVALLKSILAPVKRFLIWAKTDSLTNPNYYELYWPSGTIDWSKIVDDGFDRATYLWDVGTTYNITDARYAIYDFKLWKSLQVGNLGNTPVEGAWWTNVTLSFGTNARTWQAGVYGNGTQLVKHPTTGDLYLLDSESRPVESSDFNAEVASGLWKLVGGIPTNPPDSSSTKDLIPGSHEYNGSSTATWTLEDLATHRGKEFIIANISTTGTAILTIDTTGSDVIQETSEVSSISIFPGSNRRILAASTHFIAL